MVKWDRLAVNDGGEASGVVVLHDTFSSPRTNLEMVTTQLKARQDSIILIVITINFVLFGMVLGH